MFAFFVRTASAFTYALKHLNEYSGGAAFKNCTNFRLFKKRLFSDISKESSR